MALVMELIFLPVKARTRMVESLAAAIRHVIEMESCVASGIEEGSDFDVFNTEVLVKFEHACKRANSALRAAETFRTPVLFLTIEKGTDMFAVPFCSIEPRIKGSFEGLALIYGEVLNLCGIDMIHSSHTKGALRSPSNSR